jgi:hypothetical protein
MSTTPEPADPKAADSSVDQDVASSEPGDSGETESSGSEASDAEPSGSEASDAESSSDDADDTAAAESDSPGGGTAAPTAPTPSDAPSEDTGSQDTDGGDDEDEGASDEDRQKSAEEFAAEHDPEKHDIAAGEDFRQRGDWTAEDSGGPQVWDAEGNLVSEGDEATGDGGAADSEASNDPDTAGGRRVSDLEEVTDGGYSVGSAATIHDGAMPVGHPVKAWEDTKTYVTEDHDHYDEAEPHVWFTDAETAEQAGFRPAD